MIVLLFIPSWDSYYHPSLPIHSSAPVAFALPIMIIIMIIRTYKLNLSLFGQLGIRIGLEGRHPGTIC